MKLTINYTSNKTSYNWMYIGGRSKSYIITNMAEENNRYYFRHKKEKIYDSVAAWDSINFIVE